jgi:hypothetical protein
MDVLRTKCKAIKIIHGNYRLSIFFRASLIAGSGSSSVCFDHGEIGQAVPLFGGDAGSVWTTTAIVERGE